MYNLRNLKIGVVGAGEIGTAMAYGLETRILDSGGRVLLHDIDPKAIDGGLADIRFLALEAVRGGILKPAMARQLLAEGITAAPQLGGLAECDLVLVAVSEKTAVYRSALAGIEKVVSPDCLIGFTTSGIPRAELVIEAMHPERCFVTHPFFPAYLPRRPVELVGSDSSELTDKMYRLLIALGRVPIMVGDVVCFAADDFFCCYGNEAARLVEEGVATPAQIDAIWEAELGKMGPFAAHDGTKGNELTVACLRRMAGSHDNAWFRPTSRLVEQGTELWHDPQDPQPRDYNEATAAEVKRRLLTVLLGRSACILDNQVCSASDLNWMSRVGFAFREGVIDMIHRIGPSMLLRCCEQHAETEPTFPIPRGLRDPAPYVFFRDLLISVPDEDGIVTVTVRRPEFRNPVRRSTIEELLRVFEDLEADDDVRGVILQGFGGDLAGADIHELARLSTSDECAEFPKLGQSLVAFLLGMKTPVAAALDGFIFGAGFEIPMACLLRVISSRTRGGQTEVTLGFGPGYGGTVTLPRIVGVSVASTWLRTGRWVDAKTLVSAGWAADVADDPVARARDLLLAHISGESPVAPMDQSPIANPPAADDLPAVNLTGLSSEVDEILVQTMLAVLGLSVEDGLSIEAFACGRFKMSGEMDIGLRHFIDKGEGSAPFRHRIG